MTGRPSYPPSVDADLDAGEYALGLGSAAERAAMARRIAADPALAASVDAWNERLSPLYGEISDVDAPEHAWTGILRAISEDEGIVVDLTKRLRRWRHAAVAASAIAASLLAVLVMRPQTPVPAPPPVASAPLPLLTASVGPEAGTPVAVISFDAATRRLVVTPVGIAVSADQSPELWFIPEDGTPRSLGLIDPNTGVSVQLPGAFNTAATLAISIEPKGGSPTGLPTGVIVGTGALKRI